MSFPLVQSASNTATKTLSFLDSTIDGCDYGSKIWKTAMQQAYIEQKSEQFTTINNLVNVDSNHTPEQKAFLLAESTK